MIFFYHAEKIFFKGCCILIIVNLSVQHLNTVLQSMFIESHRVTSKIVIKTFTLSYWILWAKLKLSIIIGVTLAMNKPELI